MNVSGPLSLSALEMVKRLLETVVQLCEAEVLAETEQENSGPMA